MTTPSPTSPPQSSDSNKQASVNVGKKKRSSWMKRIRTMFSIKRLRALLSKKPRNKKPGNSSLLPINEGARVMELTPDAQVMPEVSGTVAILSLHADEASEETFLDGTPFKAPITAFNKLVEIGECIIDNKKSAGMLLEPYTERLSILRKAMESSSGLINFEPSFKSLEKTLNDTCKELDKIYKATLLNRVLELQEIPDKLEDIFKQLNLTTENFQLELGLANLRKTNRIETQLDHISLENRLGPLFEADYGGRERTTCVQGTREEILEKIISWCKDPSENTPGVYWLSGMAGTGKSTIAATVCEKLQADQDASRLAASFFCSRQSAAAQDRRNIIPTIAYHLALELSGFCHALLENFKDRRMLGVQLHLQDLLVKPWKASKSSRNGLPPLVVVIDALDEIEGSQGSEILQQILKQIETNPNDLNGLRFLVTSRPDPAITRNTMSIPREAVYHLHEVPLDTANKDIQTYLTFHLQDIPPENLQKIVLQTEGLFIYAATIIRLVIPDKNNAPSPSTQKKTLEHLLISLPTGLDRPRKGLPIDSLYEEVLQQALENEDLTHAQRQQLLALLHLVLSVKEPIEIAGIPYLVGNDMLAEEALERVNSLHAVLYVKGGHVFYYHKSFYDFVHEKTRFRNQKLGEDCSPPENIQFHLAFSCFEVMKSLKFNICGLPTSYKDDLEVEWPHGKSLKEVVKLKIPSWLAYACRHWAAHFSGIPARESEQIAKLVKEIQIWLDDRMMFWMEVMSLQKWIAECMDILNTAQKSISQHDGEVASVSLSSNGKKIISGSTNNNIVRIWNIGIGEQEQQLKGHSGSVNAVAFSHDGFKAISGSNDKTVRIWNMETSRQELMMKGHGDRVTSVAFSPRGSKAISGSLDTTVCIWNTETGRQEYRLQGHRDRVTAVAFSFDGSKAISSSYNGTIYIWNTETGNQERQLVGHSDRVNSVAFSSHGLKAISGSHDGTVRIWNVRDGQQEQKLLVEGHAVTSVAFSPDHSKAISGSGERDNTVRIWNLKTGQQEQQLHGHSRKVSSVSFSPDGSKAISGSYDKTICIWNVKTDKQEGEQLDGHHEQVNSVAFNGFRAISGSGDKTVCIWNTKTGKQEQLLQGHKDRVISVAFSSDGQKAVSGSADKDKTLCIWNLATGQQQQRLEGHTRGVSSVTFSSDGSKVISGSYDKTVRIWSLKTGQQEQQLEGHIGPVYSVAFDGSKVISGSGDKTILIWNIETGQQEQLVGHRDRVNAVAFSSDGHKAISGSNDSTVRIWNVVTSQEEQKLTGHSGWVTSVAFSPNESKAISGSFDKTVCIWNLETS
uniref:WD40 repeat-like protein n=1 Tax=Mycena chlorophos TaxID=658473 RepID=A0ABQ0LD92_MYCCL|nr:WD40 repeat-like protein [Mycena chlorophos]